MKKRTLLHIALGTHNEGLWKSMEKEFDTIHYNWLEDKESVEKINKKILSLHKKHKPDIVFMQIQSEGIIKLDTAKKITKTSFTINWTGDVRFPLPDWYIQLGKEISLTLFSNMFDVRIMKEMGLSADFLQVGFDPKVFHPFGEHNSASKIIYMGSNYLGSLHNFPLSRLRYDMVGRLKTEFGNQFTVYGNGWDGIQDDVQYLDVKQEATAYRSCDIAINLSHFDYGRYSSDRIFRLMGSGAFCLSHAYKDIEKDFVINEHISTWSNLDELVDKIRYYQQNIYERELIRMQGCKFVREKCNWDVRFKELNHLIAHN